MNIWHEWRDAPAADYAVIGDPIAHSWSPKLHRAAYRAFGLDERYEAIRVPLEEFTEALKHLTNLGYRGLNVTIPLKEAAFAWARSVDAESTPYRALNTLSLSDRRGTNTDAPGFLDMLACLGFPNPPHAVRGTFTATKERVTQGESNPEREHVLILGAGGTARTLAIALQNHGFKVTIWNRTRQRAEDLAGEVPGLLVLDKPTAKGCGLIVNATATGLTGETPPVDWTGAESGALAIDAVYASEPTPFMQAARAQGLEAADGRLMLVAQAARAFAWWHGGAPPYDAMLDAVPD